MTAVRRLLGVGTAAALVAAACSPSPTTSPEPMEIGESPSQTASAPATAGGGGGLVDPRDGGFEIGFGEYAVTLEARAIRPGPVTFVVHNGGELVHGFEMESESDEGDSSGTGSGEEDGFKIEANTFDPGETIELDLDLQAGIYKIECFVANHDDLGMEILLEVRPDAPKVRQRTADGSSVSITGFAFDPPELSVSAGTEVTWTNDDPTAHTVTADDESFDSGSIDPGAGFSVAVDGSVTYFCAIHPTMKGSITVG